MTEYGSCCHDDHEPGVFFFVFTTPDVIPYLNNAHEIFHITSNMQADYARNGVKCYSLQQKGKQMKRGTSSSMKSHKQSINNRWIKTRMWIDVNPVLTSGMVSSHATQQYAGMKYSKITTARSNDLTFFGGSCSPVERASGLSNGSKPRFRTFSSSYAIRKGKRPCISVSWPHWQNFAPTDKKSWRRPCHHECFQKEMNVTLLCHDFAAAVAELAIGNSRPRSTWCGHTAHSYIVQTRERHPQRYLPMLAVLQKKILRLQMQWKCPAVPNISDNKSWHH